MCPPVSQVKPIPFPLALECRVCCDSFYVGEGYDRTQDRLCPECFWVKEHLAHVYPAKMITREEAKRIWPDSAPALDAAHASALLRYPEETRAEGNFWRGVVNGIWGLIAMWAIALVVATACEKAWQR